MRQNGYFPDTAGAIALYFSEKAVPSQQETLGQIVVEILRDGKTLNRKMLCTKLLGRLEQAHDAEQENHYHQLLGMLFER
ncbi:two-component-system connector protein YcgZ [Pluralibacter gergoviae]|uniref:regulatory protein YcgZ n=1 Tax=Pluralibacter gergoviae TaxID=61647 RepID=UPI000650EC98|nr:regulatory protein YcgZ [Pluralibacter gergoviae]KMK19202.1 two-component-system connector protein YcgZ [Pluralibacter gergoviae]